jgi:phage shock protein C
MKRLYRSTKEKKVWGLLGGIAEYFEVDPVLIRVVFVIVLFLSGIVPGIIAYAICTYMVPLRPHETVIYAESSSSETKKDGETTS